MRNLFLMIIATAVFIGVVGYFTGTVRNNGKTELQKIAENAQMSQKFVKVGNTQIPVEVADTDEKRRQGLSGKQSLTEGTGMLFVFPDKKKPAFWMKNMNFPIDIIWIADKKIIGIEKNVLAEPGVEDSKLKLYYAPSLVDHVLEVNSGFSDKNSFKVGDTIELST